MKIYERYIQPVNLEKVVNKYRKKYKKVGVVDLGKENKKGRKYSFWLRQD